MSLQARLRRVARLESYVFAYLARHKQEDARSRGMMLDYARTQLANVALLSLYGKPKLTESLEHAWQRCRETRAWQRCQEGYPEFDWYGRRDHTSPFQRLPARHIAQCFEKDILPRLPGSNQTEKYELILQRAPPWLIWFSFCDFHARILGIKSPDLSSVSCYFRDEAFVLQVPTGPFKCRPWPVGVEDKFAHNATKKRLLNTEGMTTRQRKRLTNLFSESDASGRE